MHLFAQTKPPRLIIRGDDMGATHATNEAIIKTFKSGIETSVEVIVPSPWFLEAVKSLNENPSIDVGVHLALSSEWDNVKWRPLTAASSLRDSNGYFFPKIFADVHYPKQSLSENKWKIEDIEAELRAQIEMALSAHATLSEKIESFSKMLKSLEAGKTYMYLDHPALDGAEMQAVHHIGYENVAADRQSVADLWTNAEIKSLIKQLGIQLLSYADLKK